MNCFLKCTIAIFGFIFCNLSIAGAGAVSSTKVTQIYCGYYNGANMCSIYFDKSITNPPSCHTNNRKRMQIKTDDDTGKAILSLAMMAYISEKVVSINGKGTCNIWGDTEDMNVIFIK